LHFGSLGFCGAHKGHGFDGSGFNFKCGNFHFIFQLFQILIRIGITALTCLTAYVMVRNLEPYKTEVTDTTFLMIIVGLIGFTISSFFVSLYSQAMEAISVCYLIDKEAGGG
jgi:hypothetical protein